MDLVDYQQLTICSSQHSQEGRWLLYDQHFHLKPDQRTGQQSR